MELMEAIRGRRSVRQYQPTRLAREQLSSLIDAAVQAPSAVNRQSWAFVVIEDQTVLQRYSDGAKRLLLDASGTGPHQDEFRSTLADPAFHIFYHAPALIVIVAKAGDEYAEVDCCLAAQNLMLAAWGQGLGSCWIGLAHGWLNQPGIKSELGVPMEWTVVAPIIVGHPAGVTAPTPRREPDILHWN